MPPVVPSAVPAMASQVEDLRRLIQQLRVENEQLRRQVAASSPKRTTGVFGPTDHATHSSSPSGWSRGGFSGLEDVDEVTGSVGMSSVYGALSQAPHGFKDPAETGSGVVKRQDGGLGEQRQRRLSPPLGSTAEQPRNQYPQAAASRYSAEFLELRQLIQDQQNRLDYVISKLPELQVAQWPLCNPTQQSKNCHGPGYSHLKRADPPRPPRLYRAKDVRPLEAVRATPVLQHSIGELTMLQHRDPAVAVVIGLVKGQHRPNRLDIRTFHPVARGLLRQWRRLVLKEGLLYRTCRRPGRNVVRFQLVVPESLRKDVLEHCRECSSVEGSEELMRRSFYWPGMARTIRDWCQRGLRCNGTSGTPTLRVTESPRMTSSPGREGSQVEHDQVLEGSKLDQMSGLSRAQPATTVGIAVEPTRDMRTTDRIPRGTNPIVFRPWI